VTTTGLVHSCLKSHRIPIGRLSTHSFHDVWFSDTQNEFRAHTVKIDAADPFLRRIGHDIDFPLPGCFRICDNLGMNQARNDQVHGLAEDERAMLGRMREAVAAGADRAQLAAVYREFNPHWDESHG
jgi:hypothetical protein